MPDRKVLLLVILSCLALCVFAQQSAHIADQNRWPLVIGHRGYSARAPENTMPAFKLAIEAGADGVETDLLRTKDGKIVLMHDETLDRTTNCTGYVKDYTYAELLKCDAGAWFGPEFKGTKIPLFSELVALAKQAGVFVIMDLKGGGLIGKEIAEIVNPLGMADRMIASCWYDNQLEDIERHLKTAVRQKLSSTINYKENGFFPTQISYGVQGFSLKYAIVTPELVRLAHEHLMPVFTWTVNSGKDMVAGIKMGQDGFITNEVEVARKVVQEFHNHNNNNNKQPFVRKEKTQNNAIAEDNNTNLMAAAPEQTSTTTFAKMITDTKVQMPLWVVFIVGCAVVAVVAALLLALFVGRRRLPVDLNNAAAHSA